jgi:hypothetical protein
MKERKKESKRKGHERKEERKKGREKDMKERKRKGNERKEEKRKTYWNFSQNNKYVLAARLLMHICFTIFIQQNKYPWPVFTKLYKDIQTNETLHIYNANNYSQHNYKKKHQ